MTDAIHSVLLIDYENVGGLVPVRYMDRWLPWLQEGQFDPERRPRLFVERRLYYSNIRMGPRTDAARERMTFVECARPFPKAKNVVDVRLIMDAHEIAMRNPTVAEFVLLSADRDFLPLLERLRQMGHRVVAMRDPLSVEEDVFRRYADLEISKAQLKAAAKYDYSG